MSREIKTNSNINFEDLDYEKRRAELRYDYMHNAIRHKAIKTLAVEVQKKFKYPVIPEVKEIDNIIKFLIDGFLAYESIKLANESVAYVELDPVTLTPEINNGIKFWVQYKGMPQEKQFPDNKILYFVYSNPNNSEMSFAQSLYVGLIDATDLKFIKKHAKEIVGKLSR